jgi:2,4-dienoyl-CoA reductase-like NADH-dependent reductase (Old Yellow Enzyme family)/thioredoxin reductase
MVGEFKHLFTPCKIGTVTVPNRISFGAHVHRLGEPGDEAVTNYYEARAKGGAGLIMTIVPPAHYPTTLAYPTGYDDESIISSLKKLTDAIHRAGAKTFAQLQLFGLVLEAVALGGGAVYSASGIPGWHPMCAWHRDAPHEIDPDEIKRTLEACSLAARRLKEAEYDGIEIMSAFSFLPASFLSPAMNHRTDQYGGSLENRMRFLLELVDSVRDSVGRDFVLGVKFDVDEFIEGGITFDEGIEIAKKLEATGKLDYLFPLGGALGPQHNPPMYYPLASLAYISAAVKEVVNLPVFSVGRINDPVVAEGLLANNQADMISMMRALLADPELPRKAREGRLDEICRCIACFGACHLKTFLPLPTIACARNPEAGKEKEMAITPAKTKKTVMIIGGGAAGLETAKTAALRGHKVELYEKNDVLAKDLSTAAKAPGREDWDEVVRYYKHQMKLLGVEVHLGVTVTPEMVIDGKYDAVVVATGATPSIPKIPGADGNNVFEVSQVLQGEVEVGENVIVADEEGHMHGLSTADFLSDKKKKVELLTDSVHAGITADSDTIHSVYMRLLNKGVVITPLTKVREIQGNTITIYNVLTSTEKQIKGVDSVVFATHPRANDTLYHALKGKVKELYLIGQALSPRTFRDTVWDGARVGRAL